MTKEIFRERESALEYEFFHRVDQQLWQQLKERLECEKQEKALSDATGITDEAVLDELVELGITSETIFALTLFPLIWIAWADGEIKPKERGAILEAAHSTGHQRDTASHRLIESWLEHEPGEEIHRAWTDYVHAICQTVSPDLRRALQHDIVTRTRQVAKAAGGILGFHKVSHAQELILEKVKSTFEGAWD